MTLPAPPPSNAPRHAAAQRPDQDAPKPHHDSAPQFILASASPRRSALLHEAGYVFTTFVSNIDESDHSADLTAEQLARHLAERKARAVAEKFSNAVVLGADTVVAVRRNPTNSPAAVFDPEAQTRREPLGSRLKSGEQILGKPTDLADARRILNLLSGTTHEVITAVAVVRHDPAFAEFAAVHSTVHMRPLTSAELDAYLATNQWQDKAGAYGIQDNDPFVTAIAGCHTNIVGLPMTATHTLIANAGVHPLTSCAAHEPRTK
jgi:septum formation protein